MATEPPFRTMIPFVALNVASALLCAAAHNHLYFMLGFTTFAFHFMHYFFTFLALLVACMLGKIPRTNGTVIDKREFYGVAFTQFCVSLASGVIHSGGRDGALYAIRFSDAGVTILVILLGKKFLEKKAAPNPDNNFLLIVMAIASAVSWVEPGIMDYSFRAMACVPVISVANAFHILLVYQKFQKLGISMELFLMYTSGLVSVLLIGPAIYFNTDNFNKDLVSIASAWEIIDYVLLLMAMSFMIALTYSKYWLMTSLTPESFLVIRHFKFTLAALGQWFAHNFVYANFVSGSGRLFGCGTLVLYALRRRYRMGPPENTSQSVI